MQHNSYSLVDLGIVAAIGSLCFGRVLCFVGKTFLLFLDVEMFLSLVGCSGRVVCLKKWQLFCGTSFQRMSLSLVWVFWKGSIVERLAYIT